MSTLTIPFGAKLAAIVLAGVVATGASVAASVSATGIAFEEIAELTTTEEEAPDPVVEAGELPAIDTESGLEEEGEEEEGEEGEDTEDGEEDGEASTKGPDATGSAAYGLCNAWSNGGLPDHSTAYGALEAAAGSADEVEEYCDSLPAKGKKDKGGDVAEDGDETTDGDTDGEETEDGDTEDTDADATETEKADKSEKSEKSNNGNGKSEKKQKKNKN